MRECFDQFTPQTNPHGERHCGAFERGKEQIFWKIDYSDWTLSAERVPGSRCEC
jgi:Protein of unknown function (DUF3768)